jgi:hypothetical protein
MKIRITEHAKERAIEDKRMSTKTDHNCEGLMWKMEVNYEDNI